MAYPYIPPLQNKFVTMQIEDISTAGQRYFAPGFRGKIKKVYSVLNGAIATADSVLTIKISGTAVTGGTITVAYTSSAAGDLDSCIPTGANLFSDTDVIEVETGGQSTNTIPVDLTFELEPV